MKIETLLNENGYNADFIINNEQLVKYAEVMHMSGKFVESDIIGYLDYCKEAVLKIFETYENDTAIAILADENFDITNSDTLGYIQIPLSDDKYINLWSIEYEGGRK